MLNRVTYVFLDDTSHRHNYKYLELAETCPKCGIYTLFDFISEGRGLEAKEMNYLVQCPRCHNIFLAQYILDGNENHFFKNLYPQSTYKNSFPKEINEFTPTFFDIYNQAMTAKIQGLKELVGLGLRKALEFLIYDYIKNVLNIEPAKTLQKRIEQIDIKNVQVHATLARWIGNDNTHIQTTHPEFSVEDMIKSIDIIVYYLYAEYNSTKLAQQIQS